VISHATQNGNQAVCGTQGEELELIPLEDVVVNEEWQITCGSCVRVLTGGDRHR